MARAKAKIGDLTELIVPVVVIGGMYLLYNKLFGSDATSGGANNKVTDDSSKAAAAKDQAAAAAAGITQTLSNNTLNGYATDLYTKITNFTGDDLQMSDIVAVADQVNNQADWNALVNYFGVRKFNSGMAYWSWCNLFGYDCTSMDLPSALRLVLDSDHKDALNSYFTMQGINASI